MPKTKSTSNTSSKGLLFWGLAALIGVIVLVAVLELTNVTHLFHKKPVKTQPTATAPAGSVNYGPTTDEEKRADEQHKQDLSNQSDNSQPASGTKTVQPVITYAAQSGNQIEVDTFVSGVVEDGGTCTLKLTQGGTTVTKTTQGVRNATTTACPAFFVNRSELSASGTWTAVVSYSSTTAQGSSSAKTIEVK